MMDSINLRQETFAQLKEHGFAPADVLWVGSQEGDLKIGWDEFASIADMDYDNVSPPTVVAVDLVIVGSNWWCLERQDCEGTEWWEFRTLPVVKDRAEKFHQALGSFGAS